MTFRYISLFSGAGGLDIGLERAGFSAVSLCEIEKPFCKTLEENKEQLKSDGHTYFSQAKVINSDIRKVSKKELLNGAQSIDLVVGGPPCQSFSSSGKQLSVLDPRGELLDEFCRVVKQVKPKTFLFENVRGLVTARNKTGRPGGVIKDVIKRLENLGYSVRASLLNSADFGSYQRRVRCFLVGSANGLAPEFPLPTHSKVGDMVHSKWNTLGDFLKRFGDNDFENYVFPTEQLFKELENLPNGKGLKSAGKSEPTRPNGHWGYRQGTFIADLELPARTVTGSSSQDWIRWNNHLRRLTLEEVKLLQEFPSDWTLFGSKAQMFKQIGNAVPAVFGEVLGKALHSHLRDFPNRPPEMLEFPKEFSKNIDCTIRDHARNASAREIHKNFGTR